MQFETSLNQTLLPKYTGKFKIKPVTAISSVRIFPNRQQHFPTKVQPDLLKSRETSSRELQLSSHRATPIEIKIPNLQRNMFTTTNSTWLGSPTMNPLVNSLINPSSREKSILSQNKDFLFTKRPATIKMAPRTPKIGENRKDNAHAFPSFSKDAVSLQNFIFGERTTAIDNDINQFEKPYSNSMPVSRAGKKSIEHIYSKIIFLQD